MTIKGKITSTLLYSSAPIALITSGILAIMGFVSDVDCKTITEFNNINMTNVTHTITPEFNILQTNFCNNFDVNKARMSMGIISFIWSCVITLQTILVKTKMTKMKQEIEIKEEKIETLSVQNEAMSTRAVTILPFNNLNNEPYYAAPISTRTLDSEHVIESSVNTNYPSPNSY